MSATIDHLSAHYRVKVLKAFTDARGLSVPEGAIGVIRHIGLDTKLMEFTIDWERDGKLETLAFSLSAKDGVGLRVQQQITVGESHNADGQTRHRRASGFIR